MLRDLLASTALADRLSCVATATAWAAILRGSNEVQRAREALSAGAVEEATVGRLLEELLRDFRSGEHFAHEVAVAALAVVLEDRPTAFAESFLEDLASLSVAEMTMSSRVARECLRRRRADLSTNTVRLFRIAQLVPTEGGPTVVGAPYRVDAINTMLKEQADAAA